jgi:salicylate hydroxylase
LHLNKIVEEYDVDNNRFKVRSRKHDQEGASPSSTEGEWIKADIILASDGIKSKARSVLLKRHNEVDEIVDTGQAAYRILVHRSMINEDPELIPLFTGAHSYRWIGEKRHIIAYPISASSSGEGTIFNMSTAHPDRRFVAAESWTTTGSKKEMLDTFSDFCPRVQKLLQLVPEGSVLEWKLRVHSPVRHWVDGHMALVGDACHPTLPHLAQGAAQAIEDAAVLGIVLSKIEKEDDIRKALLVYQVSCNVNACD